MSRRRKQILTPAEAARAVYIDFEAREEGPQTLIGVLYLRDPGDADSAVFNQYVLDERFQRCATYSVRQGKLYVSMRSLAEIASDLADLLESEDRLLVAWSMHELEVFEAHVECCDYMPVLRKRYRNAIDAAKRWKGEFYPDIEFEVVPGRGRNRLEEYMKLVDYEVPSVHSPGKTGERIRNVLAALLKSDREFEQMPPSIKKYWTNLLMHNWHDCFGMMAVMIRATGDLTRESEAFTVVKVEEGRSVSGQPLGSDDEHRGEATVFRVTGRGEVDLEVGDIVWETGERHLQVLDRRQSPQRFDRLVQGLRLGVTRKGDVNYVVLQQARMVNENWSNLFKASPAELSSALGVDATELLADVGAHAVGTKADVLQDSGRSRFGLCATFGAGSDLVPIWAYVITRIAPIEARVRADR